jgi:photosystem II stability/assembly factor-like uncharacterized protein
LAIGLAACTPTQPAGPANPAPDANANHGADPNTQLPYDLQAVDFVNISHGWVAGNDEGNNVSVILRTADGGATWFVAAEVLGDTLLDVDFADERSGWAVGTSGVVYGSTDGGLTWAAEPAASWQRQYSHEPVTLPAQGTNNIAPVINESVASVYFADAKTGWAAGDAPTGKGFDVRGLVLGTTDGGKSWSELKSAAGEGAPYPVNGLWFTSPKDGWAAAGNLEDAQEDVLLRTTDGGRTWERSDPKSAEYPRAVQFLDASHGWAVGMTVDQTTDLPGPSKILGTTDGGATWTVRFTSPRSFFGLCFADAKRGWAVGDRAAIYATTDGGATWRPQTRFVTTSSRKIKAPAPGPDARGFRTVFALDAANVWVAGEGVILKRRASAEPTKSAGR